MEIGSRDWFLQHSTRRISCSTKGLHVNRRIIRCHPVDRILMGMNWFLFGILYFYLVHARSPYFLFKSFNKSDIHILGPRRLKIYDLFPLQINVWPFITIFKPTGLTSTEFMAKVIAPFHDRLITRQVIKLSNR